MSAGIGGVSGFPKIQALVGSPSHKDHSILGSMLGPPCFVETFWLPRIKTMAHVIFVLEFQLGCRDPQFPKVLKEYTLNHV